MFSQKKSPRGSVCGMCAQAATTTQALFAKTRAFWRRQFADPLLAQLTQGITPDKIALTIAVGSALAMFPIIGVTSLLCLLAGVLLRLNQPILQMFNQTLFPLHVAAIWLCARWGEALFREPHAQYGGLRAMARHMGHLFWHNQAGFWGEFGTLVWHAIVVWALLAPFWMLAMYFIARPVVRALARWRQNHL